MKWFFGGNCTATPPSSMYAFLLSRKNYRNISSTNFIESQLQQAFCVNKSEQLTRNYLSWFRVSSLTSFLFVYCNHPLPSTHYLCIYIHIQGTSEKSNIKCVPERRPFALRKKKPSEFLFCGTLSNCRLPPHSLGFQQKKRGESNLVKIDPYSCH